MTILRRTFVALAFCGLVASSAEVLAKGPRVRIFATLVRTSDAPAAAKGKAKFDQTDSRTNFSVEAQNLLGLDGQTASVYVNGSLVGTKVVALGAVKLELTNQRGGSVPAVSAGTRVDIAVGSTRILSGSF